VVVYISERRASKEGVEHCQVDLVSFAWIWGKLTGNRCGDESTTIGLVLQPMLSLAFGQAVDLGETLSVKADSPLRKTSIVVTSFWHIQCICRASDFSAWCKPPLAWLIRLQVVCSLMGLPSDCRELPLRT